MAWWDSDDIKKTIKSWWSDIPNVTITKDTPGQGNMSGGTSDLIKANLTEQDLDDPKIRLGEIKSYLKEKGFSNKAIAGIMGNIEVESRSKTNAYSFDTKEEGGRGYGIFQLDAKKENYDTYLKETGKKDSMESQVDFMYDTIYGDYKGVPGAGNAEKLRNLFESKDSTVKDITLGFQNIWERPDKARTHSDWRLESANKFYGEDLYNEAQKAYPYLRNRDIDYVYNPDDNPKSGYLEFWEPGDEGPPDGSVKRPAGISLDKYGIEVRKEATRPIDLLGDYASHLGVQHDPKLKKIFEDYSASIDEKQLKDRYAMEQERYGENRDYDLWKERSGIPGLFRGYTFDQFPDNVKAREYTPDQMKILDRAKEYLNVEMKPLEE